VNQKETHSDHREDDADGAENGLGRYEIRDPPGDIQGLDSGIQRGEGIIPAVLSLGLDIHGFKVNVTRENGDAGRL